MRNRLFLVLNKFEEVVKILTVDEYLDDELPLEIKMRIAKCRCNCGSFYMDEETENSYRVMCIKCHGLLLYFKGK